MILIVYMLMISSLWGLTMAYAIASSWSQTQNLVWRFLSQSWSRGPNLIAMYLLISMTSSYSLGCNQNKHIINKCSFYFVHVFMWKCDTFMRRLHLKTCIKDALPFSPTNTIQITENEEWEHAHWHWIFLSLLQCSLSIFLFRCSHFSIKSLDSSASTYILILQRLRRPSYWSQLSKNHS